MFVWECSSIRTGDILNAEKASLSNSSEESPVWREQSTEQEIGAKGLTEADRGSLKQCDCGPGALPASRDWHRSRCQPWGGKDIVPALGRGGSAMDTPGHTRGWELGCSPCSRLLPNIWHRWRPRKRGQWHLGVPVAAGMPGEAQAHVRARLHPPGGTNVLF